MSASVRLRRALLATAAAVVTAIPLLVATPAPAQQRCGHTGDHVIEAAPWPIRRLDLASAWPLSRGQDVVVAVIDSGVNPDHPSLQGRVLSGHDINLPDHSGHCDDAGHGTLVAGIIAGRDDTNSPFVGVAPQARILPIRVLEDVGRVTDPQLPSYVADAIRWAVDNDADVINLSLETVPTNDLAEAVQYAWENDVVMVAAAGNVEDGEVRGPAFPAAFQEVIAVAGVDSDGRHVDTSVSGDYITVAAPGHHIEGPASRGDGFIVEPDGGTSYATAYVSGVAALVRAYSPHLNATEVMARIRLTADRPPAGYNELVGYGVVNPYRALTTVLGSRTNPPVEPVEPSALPPDPLATEKRVAAVVAAAGGLLTILLLLGRPVLRRGRLRGWRPGRAGLVGQAAGVAPAPEQHDDERRNNDQ